VEVEEYDSLSSTMQNSLEFTIPELKDTSGVTVGVLCDILKPTTAATLACYREDYYADKPAITLNQFGKGRAIYVGAMGDGQLYDALAKWLLERTNMQSEFTMPLGVEVTQRTRGDKKLHFILNHTNSPQTIHLEGRYNNLLDRMQLQGDVQLESFDVLILASSNHE
jgi:beta-galactosidase